MRKTVSFPVIGLVLAIAMGSVYFFHSVAAGQDKPMPEKPRWEYKVLETIDESRKLEQEITKAAEDGWELIGVVSSVRDGGFFSVRKGDSIGSVSVKTNVKLIVKRAKQ